MRISEMIATIQKEPDVDVGPNSTANVSPQFDLSIEAVKSPFREANSAFRINRLLQFLQNLLSRFQERKNLFDKVSRFF
jgi:hypothetical protein